MWGSNYGYGYDYPMMGYGYGGIGVFFSILWAVVVIVAIVALVRFVRGKSGRGFGFTHSALDTLKERYAKGEIDKKEFEEKKKDITE